MRFSPDKILNVKGTYTGSLFKDIAPYGGIYVVYVVVLYCDRYGFDLNKNSYLRCYHIK